MENKNVLLQNTDMRSRIVKVLLFQVTGPSVQQCLCVMRQFRLSFQTSSTSVQIFHVWCLIPEEIKPLKCTQTSREDELQKLVVIETIAIAMLFKSRIKSNSISADIPADNVFFLYIHRYIRKYFIYVYVHFQRIVTKICTEGVVLK